MTRLELNRKAIRMRWMDDVVYVADENLSRAAKATLRRMLRKEAYGEELQLLRTEGAEAFGFQWRIRDGILEIFQDEKWLDPLDSLWGLERLKTLYDGYQYARKAARIGVLVGYFLRILDCTNADRQNVEMMTRRLQAGLLEVGHKPADLEKALWRAQKEARCDLRADREWMWNREKRRRFIKMYDVARYAEQRSAEMATFLNRRW